MKKVFALVVALAMVLCICGCKNSDTDNLSSDSVEVEYQEIIVDETGSTITQTNDSSTQSDNNSSVVETPSQSTPSSNVTSKIPAITIDYNTVVEVDICDDIIRGYLDAKDATNQYFWLSTYSGQKLDHQSLSLDWYRDGSMSYTIYFSENADFSNAMTITTNYSDIEGTTLIPGKTYYWKVTGTLTADALGGGKIKVKDAPVRWIQIDGIHNVRDLGGWKAASGKAIKYGMIYRGPNIDDISDAGIATIKQLGIKTELDIRRLDQKLQKQGTGMNYIFLESHAQYDRIFDSAYEEEVKRNYKEIFKILSDESNYPFYVHCQHGADRTGTFAFITNGVLGVAYEDLTRDFEVSSFAPGYKRWRGEGKGNTFAKGDDIMQNDQNNYVAWGVLYKRMMEEYGTGDGKLSSAIENYLINYIGVPQSQIDSFKSIMLG